MDSHHAALWSTPYDDRDKYSMVKYCPYAQRNAECLDTALSRGILAIYHKPEVAYCNYKLVANVIRTVKIHVLSYLVHGLIYHGCQPISIQGFNHPF